MIQALIWKEYREHRGIWLLFACCGAAVALGLPHLMAYAYNPIAPESTLFFAVGFTVLYGIFCGAVMLAGESDNGTLDFLDTVAERRFPLWRTKAVFGLMLTIALALLLGLAAAMGQPRILELTFADRMMYFLGRSSQMLPYHLTLGSFLTALVLVSCTGYALGLLTAVLCKRVVPAVCVALLLLLLAVLLNSAGVNLWFQYAILGPPEGAVVESFRILTLALMGPMAAALSAYLFCRRESSTVLSGSVFLRSPTFWLCWRQARWTIICLVVALPFVMLLAYWMDLGIWPMGTLLVGIVCGTASFFHEQSNAGYRFLGDRRLPIGRVWALKTSFWLLVTLAICSTFVGLATEVGIRHTQQLQAWSRSHQLPGVDAYLIVHADPVAILGLWLAYGFAVAQFFAIVMRKSLVAIFLTIATVSLVLILWLPSLVVGGVSRWQLFLLPIGVLGLCRLSLWTWVSDRLTAANVTGFISIFVLTTTAWMGGNLWWRSASVPDLGEPFDIAAFEARLPTGPSNEGGRLTLRSVTRYGKLARELWSTNYKEVGNRQGFQKVFDASFKGNKRIEWPTNDAAVVQALDWLVQKEWYKELRAASQLPSGMLQDPRSPTPDSTTTDCAQAISFLSWRALQLQAKGDCEGELEQIAMWLALLRNMRNFGTEYERVVATQKEAPALDLLGKWLAKHGSDSVLLQHCLDILNRHAAETPAFVDCMKAEYLWRRYALVQHRNGFSATQLFDLDKDMPPELSYWLFMAPWEKERLERLNKAYWASTISLASTPLADINDQRKKWDNSNRGERLFAYAAGNDGRFNAAYWLSLFDPRFQPWLNYSVYKLIQSYTQYSRLKSQTEAYRTCTALALFQIKEGRPARDLDELVPTYFKEIPTDSVTNSAFHYRVSTGEEFKRTDEQSTVKVANGQGLVWSTMEHGWEGISPEKTIGPFEVETQNPRRVLVLYLVPTQPAAKGGNR